jgi:hypothetical protein
MISNYLKNNRGFTVVEGLLIAIIVMMLAGGGYYVYQARQDKTKADATPAPKAEDPTKDWKSYTAPVDGLTFKYPADWKLKTETGNAPGGEQETATVSSPDGFELIVTDPIDGFGGGCEDPCPIVTETYSAEKYDGLGIANLYIVKQWVYDTTDKVPANDKRIGFYQPDPEHDVYKVNMSKYQGFPPYLVFDSKKAQDGAHVMAIGAYPATHPKAKLPLDQYFNLPDLKTGEQILRTFTY